MMHRIAVHSPMLALRERYDNPYSLKRRKKKKNCPATVNGDKAAPKFPFWGQSESEIMYLL